MITSHSFPETQFIAVTAYQNEEVCTAGEEKRFKYREVSSGKVHVTQGKIMDLIFSFFSVLCLKPNIKYE